MSSTFVTNGKTQLCLVEDGDKVSAFRLNGFENYGFSFYGKNHDFELYIKNDKPLLKQPYGLLGRSVDLSGRMLSGNKNVVRHYWTEKVDLKCPIYSFCGNLDKNSKMLEDFEDVKEDVLYVCITASADASSMFGDDYYKNTIFFSNKGYGILTEISAVAGRDIEDCCSPEYYYATHKVSIEDKPLKGIEKKDMVLDAMPIWWALETSPILEYAITKRIGKNEKEIKNFNKILSEYYETLKPRGD